MLANLLLPAPDVLRLKQVIADDALVTLVVETTAADAACPDCQLPSTAVHSRYSRKLNDLACGLRRVRLHLFVRRFFCRNTACQRRTFAERIPQITQPWARRTARLSAHFWRMATALGGEAGARLCVSNHLRISGDTLLRILRKTPQPQHPTPRVLGVDDFAFRKGRRYGTILVDLERSCPIDLLPKRDAASLAEWLKNHPGVEVISRDRAGAYAEGAKAGAPHAIQIADRWHLLSNLGDAVEDILVRIYPQLVLAWRAKEAQVTAPETGSSSAEECASTAPVHRPPGKRKSSNTKVSEQAAARLEHRRTRYEEVVQLYEHGWSLHAIAQRTGADRKTVRKWLRAGSFQQARAHPHKRTKLDRYIPYLLERWDGGCRNAAKIWSELSERGFTGGKTIVRDFMAQLRVAENAGTAGTAQRSVRRKLPSVSKLRQILGRQPEKLDAQELEFVLQACTGSQDLSIAYGLLLDFSTMLRERQREHLNSWLHLVQQSGIAELQPFANGVLRDYAAVGAALELPYSNGPVEGEVNKLKLIKRSMFGRGNFDLLRLRVLHAT